jgi:hypothetical protein
VDTPADTLPDTAPDPDVDPDPDPDTDPGPVETCNGVDDDGDGSIDEGGVCPCPVHERGGHAYMFCTTPAGWPDALAACSGLGYGLLSINDSGEESWVNLTLDTYTTLRTWMGFNDRATEGTWVWQSGDPVAYTNWYEGEPNNSGNEDCGQLNRFHPHLGWNDEPCDRAYAYVCESG